MLTKIKNLFVREKRFTAGIIIILAIILALLFFSHLSKKLALKLKNVNVQWQLVIQIPQLKKQVEGYEKKEEKEAEEAINENLVLKGIFSQDGQYSVLIGDTFYREGDTCGSYIISKIDFNYVILQDKDTKKTDILTFPDNK